MIFSPQPPEAAPVETHVHLQTGESDETAQEMLDISEQTCFLHAFCRTEDKTENSQEITGAIKGKVHRDRRHEHFVSEQAI